MIVASLLAFAVWAWKFVERLVAVKQARIAKVPQEELLSRFLEERERSNDGSEHLIFDNSAVFDSDVNSKLDTCPVRMRLLTEHYRLPDLVAMYRTRLLSGDRAMLPDTTNDLKVRLASELLGVRLETISEVCCQPTDYYSGQLTNDCAGLDVLDGHGGKLIAGGEYWLRWPRILPLEESRASNQIGITSLCICAGDKEAFLVTQLAERQQISGEMLGPSGSGSLDWEDIDACSSGKSDLTLQNVLRLGMERELAEEIGAQVGATDCRTFMTGYVRLLSRGGKPEFFGLTVTRQPAGELHPAERKVAQIYRDRVRLAAHECADDVEASMRIRSQHHQAPRVLLLATRFAVEFLRRLPSGTSINQVN